MKFREINVKCPFYISADANKLRCEGIFKKSKITTAFKSDTDTDAVFNDLCCDKYKDCPLYQTLFKNIG